VTTILPVQATCSMHTPEPMVSSLIPSLQSLLSHLRTVQTPKIPLYLSTSHQHQLMLPFLSRQSS
jgi:hypothetical protein